MGADVAQLRIRSGGMVARGSAVTRHHITRHHRAPSSTRQTMMSREGVGAVRMSAANSVL